MLYSEFVAGTGCKENEHNYKVYKDLEIMYMNSDMTKEQVYEYGKKLVDNSKSEAQLKLEAEVKAEIAALKEDLEDEKSWVKHYKTLNSITDNAYKDNLNYHKRMVKARRNRIAALKWVLA